MSDLDAELYYPLLDREYRKAGFTNIKPGECPLLLAEDLLRRNERFFGEMCIEVTRKAGYTPEMIDEILNATHGLDNRKKFLEINLSYVVPFIPKNELMEGLR